MTTLSEAERESLMLGIRDRLRRAGNPAEVTRWWADDIASMVGDQFEAILTARLARVIEGVRAWCAINEIAEPPLDWAGLGEFLDRAALSLDDAHHPRCSGSVRDCCW